MVVPARMRAMVLSTMHRLVSLIEQDLLKPLLALTFPLHELCKAQEIFLQKKYVGNIVVEL